MSPVTISDGYNNVHFITAMTNNPGFTWDPCWGTHKMKNKGLIMLSLGNCKVGRWECINY